MPSSLNRDLQFILSNPIRSETQKYQLQVLALGHWLNRLDYLMSPLSRLNLLYVVVKKILLQLWQLLTHLLRNAVFFTLLPPQYGVDARLCTTLKHIIAVQEKKRRENRSEQLPTVLTVYRVVNLRICFYYPVAHCLGVT